MPQASIIIPTFKRTASLVRTLESLLAQDVEDFEIIVADNAGQEETRRAILDRGANARVPLRYFANATGDNATGRNLGAKAAASDLLVYTDDDLTFPRNWLRAYVEAFAAHPDMVAAGGRVVPEWEAPPPAWLEDFMGEAANFGVFALMSPFREFTLSRDGFFYSCNMAVRREVFSVTSFHPELYGWKTVGDGEAGMNQDIWRNGDLIGYVPEAVAHHHIGGQRLTLAYLLGWAGHLAGNQMYRRWRLRPRTPLAFLAELARLTRIFSRYWWKYPFVRGRLTPKRAVEIQFNAVRGWQSLAYLWRIPREENLRQALDIRDFRLENRYPGAPPETVTAFGGQTHPREFPGERDAPLAAPRPRADDLPGA